MRVRLPFAGVFFVLLLVAGYAGLTSQQQQLGGLANDKVLHAATFFLLTVVFYWIVDTSRRRTLNMALVVCTLGMGVGSELLQAAIPNNGRAFDAMDIAANIAGSLAALALCSWYHKRMLERKRLRKYTAVPGEGGDVLDGVDGVDGENDDDDLELGEGIGRRHHHLGSDGSSSNGSSSNGSSNGSDTATATTMSGATTAVGTTMPSITALSASAADRAAPTTALHPHAASLEEELDRWDENAEDDDDDAWGEGDGDIGGAGAAATADVLGRTKKRID